MPVLASPLELLPALASLEVRVAVCPTRVCLPFACRYAIPFGLCSPRARSGCPSGLRRVSVGCGCARASAAFAPPHPVQIGVAPALRAVLVQGASWAISGSLSPSAFPALVPCSASLARGGVALSFRPLAFPGVARPPAGRPPFVYWLCALWGRHEVARGSRLSPGCGASGVGRSRTPDRPSFGACGRGPLPTGCGCGGYGRGDPSPTPQRALLRAGFARCGGGTTAPGGGASCLGVGRPGPGALLPPTARPLGCAAGAHHPLALGAGAVGVGTRHQPHSARSCELALGAAGAARERPGGAPLAWVWGVRGRALPRPRPPVLWAVWQGPATHWLWVRPTPQHALLRAGSAVSASLSNSGCRSLPTTLPPQCVVARGADAAGSVLLACRQWDPHALAQRLPSSGAAAWHCVPLLPWRVQCPGRLCAALAAGLGGWGRCRFRVSPVPPSPFPRFPRCVWRVVPSGCPLYSK